MSAEISGGVAAGGRVHLQLCRSWRLLAACPSSADLAAELAFCGHGEAEQHLPSTSCHGGELTTFIDQQGDKK